VAHHAIVEARGWTANSANVGVRLTAKNNQLKHEIELLRGEFHTKDTRLAKIDPRG